MSAAERRELARIAMMQCDVIRARLYVGDLSGAADQHVKLGADIAEAIDKMHAAEPSTIDF